MFSSKLRYVTSIQIKNLIAINSNLFQFIGKKDEYSKIEFNKLILGFECYGYIAS